MSYQLLYNELGRYPGVSDAEIAAALNVVAVVSKLAKTDDIIALAYNIGLYQQLNIIVLGNGNGYPVELRAIAKSLIDLNLGTIPEIDPFAPASVAMLDGLIAAGLITLEQRGQFEALGIASRTSRAGQLGFPEGVTVEDIEASRAWVEAQAQVDALRGRLQSAYNQAMGMLNELPVPEWADIVAVFEAA